MREEENRVVESRTGLVKARHDSKRKRVMGADMSRRGRDERSIEMKGVG
jgi:hypothetical protein